MLRLCLFLLAGAYALELLPDLPPGQWRWPALLVAAVLFAVRRLRDAGALAAGALLVWNAALAVERERLPPDLEGETLTVSARIAQFPQARGGSIRFLAVLEEPGLPARVRLTWYAPPQPVGIGETWRLVVRLRRPRGHANPIRFDYELWLARARVGATGYVVEDSRNERLAGVVSGRAALRDRLVRRIEERLGRNDASAVLMAVTVGARHRIDGGQWERYAISGTSHLMAISGLHIGLAAGAAYVVGWLAAAPLLRSRSPRDAGLLCALCAACLYAWISGFAVPAQRAMLMVLPVTLALLLRREPAAERVLALACLLVTACDPLAIHAPGFKLSFAAVALLLWLARQHTFEAAGPAAAAWRRAGRALRRLGALQCCLLVGLLPLTASLFGRAPVAAPLVNLLVLPIFNFVTVPAGLLGLLLDGPLAPAGDRLLRAAWASVRLVLAVVDRTAQLPAARIDVAAPGGLMVAVALLPALYAAAPPGFPGRRLALVAAAALCLQRPAPPPPGCFDLAVLDVGQGLAVVLRTHRRVLLYDSGPAFRGGGNAAELVVVPYLRSLGVGALDLMVISHGDADHAGGVQTVVDAVEVRQLLAGGPLAASVHPQLACRSGQAWLWDGVQFSMLHPGLYPRTSDNDASCVLEVRAGNHAALLTGDIEGAVESHLARIAALSAADVVLVPHHGSRTSSRAALVEATRPSFAIVSSGYGNRWGFPATEVVGRWEDAGAEVLNTATSGAITLRVCEDGGVRERRERRVHYRKYWHDRRP